MAEKSPRPAPNSRVELEVYFRVQARTQFSGLPLSVEIVGAPVAENGQLRIDVSQMLLNGGAAPGFVQSQVTETLNEHLQGENFPLEVDFIDVQQGAATIRGRKK